MEYLSVRGKSLKPSPTLALVSKAKELQSQGHDVISLSVGEPDWDTISCAKEAGKSAIDRGFTKYTAAEGMLELRAAIAKQTSADFGIEYQPQQVSVAAGAKFSLFSALQVVLNPGDEVIMAGPYWVSYPTMVELAGGVPVITDPLPHSGFKMTPSQLESAITKKSRVLLLNSPNNPTGAIYSQSELRSLAEVVRKNRDLLVFSDDIYNRLQFDEKGIAPQLLMCAPDLRDRVVSFNGVSKSYSMTGWRIGWGVGPKEIIQTMGYYQSQAMGAPSSISQAATLAAITEGQAEVERARLLLKERRDIAVEAIQSIPGLKVTPPAGSFYLWVDVTHYQTHSQKSREISERLLQEKKVATVPGFEFGLEGYLRLSFALKKERMLEAFDRMSSFFSQQ